jgi:allantoin racemase
MNIKPSLHDLAREHRAKPVSTYRFLLMLPFRLPTSTKWRDPGMHKAKDLPKEDLLMNYDMVIPHLVDVDWDLHPGAEPPYGNWPVETRAEFAYAGTARLDNVRAACKTEKYNAIVLLGGGDPGYLEAREICRDHGIVCTTNGHSQMAIATMLGRRFSVIDIAGVHNVYYRDLIYRYCLQDFCASIRNIGLRLPRPGIEDAPQMNIERDKACSGEPSIAVDNAIEQAEAAILEDGAEVITLGCSGVFWLQPFIKQGLEERGWDVPVLEGYTAAIEHAKMLVNLGVTASGITFMADHPRRIPRKIIP